MILRESALNGLAAFGANEDYCDKTYPVAAGGQVATWNTKCKKTCSGLDCVTNSGLLAAPWTVLGKNARGLPDDSILGAALDVGKSLVTQPKTTGGGTLPPLLPAKGSGVTGFLTSPIGIALGGVAIVGLAFGLRYVRKHRKK